MESHGYWLTGKQMIEFPSHPYSAHSIVSKHTPPPLLTISSQLCCSLMHPQYELFHKSRVGVAKLQPHLCTTMPGKESGQGKLNPQNLHTKMCKIYTYA